MYRFIVVGPVPVMSLPQALEQVENQEWEVRFVCFAGMGAAVSPLVRADRRMAAEPIPLFAVIACREIVPGTEPELPKINLQGGPDEENNHRQRG